MEKRSIKELYQEALDIQNASNLCGLAQSFAKVMIELGEYSYGTESRNRHPITILWLDKMNSLAGLQGNNELASDCYIIAEDYLRDYKTNIIRPLESFDQIIG